ncbi:MAG TPA: TIR domain-containing protein [Synechococcales cyanobacterium M55_K2018_004]|nr:TIR domain-containing protein [Synechococcales cyanobacterium M55_K2018_004]
MIQPSTRPPTPEEDGNVTGLRLADILGLPQPLQTLMNWMLRRKTVTVAEAAAHCNQSESEMEAMLQQLVERHFVKQVTLDGAVRYEVRLAHKSNRRMPKDIWKVLNLQNEAANVFISYSRRNKEFVRSLAFSLQKRGREVWVDWESIPFGTDWWEEIKQGIELADCFIFVISTASVSSEVCARELAHALANQKRILPVVYEEVPPPQVPPELSKLNWVFLRRQDDFDQGFRSLIHALDTDLAYVRNHTRLLVRANEWKNQHGDTSLLLRGRELAEARRWLSEGEAKEPRPHQVQKEYIWSSYNAELAAQQAELDQQRQGIRRQRIWLGLVAAASSLAVAFGIGSYVQYRRAVESRAIAEDLRVLAERERLGALTETAAALFQSGQIFESLLKSVKAGVGLQQAAGANDVPELRARVITALQQSIFWVRERNQLEDHTGIVWDTAFSPDGVKIASASADGSAKIWGTDGTLLTTVRVPNAQVQGVVFSPDSRIFATAATDGTIRLWNLGGTAIRTIQHPSGPVYAIAISPDGSTLAAAYEDGAVRLWRRDGTLVSTLDRHIAAVRDVVFSPDGELLASAADDGTIRLWQADGTFLKTLRGHTAKVASVQFSPDGQFLVSASSDYTVRLWQRDGTAVRIIKAHDYAVYDARFSPDGQVIASAGLDKTIRLWRPDGTLLSSLEGHTSQVRSLSFSPNGQRLASGSGDRTIKLWQLHRPLVETLQQHRAQVYDVRFSADGQTVATASADFEVKLWRRDGTPLAARRGHTAPVWAVAFSPDGKQIAAASSDRTIKLWDHHGNLLNTLVGHGAPVKDVAFSPDGKLIASASEDRTVKLWQRDGRLLHTLPGHAQGVLSVTFSPNSQTLVSTSWDNSAMLWDVQGHLLHTLQGHSGWVYSAAFSPDGQTIATASFDNTVRLWQPDGTLLQILEGHHDGVVAVRFSTQGNMIATGSFDHTIKLWRPDGRLITTLRGHSGRVNAVEFSQDGHLLATASDDRTVLLWHLDQMDDLDHLLTLGCDWLQDYLKTNRPLPQGDRSLCQDIPPPATP